MPLITLTTDFGIEDEYVGIMKGVILSINPSAAIIDITHHVDPQDINQAAQIIKSSYKYFPKGTIHVIVVDPGVGSNRAILALEMMGYFFIAPDNGVLTHLMDEGDLAALVQVVNSKYFLKAVSQTFHGRDIFAPVAAHISNGLKIQKLGAKTDKKNIVCLDIRKPSIIDNNTLIGAIMWIDHFGNLITDIDSKILSKFCDKEKKLEIRIGANKIYGLSVNYESAGLQSPVAVIGSRGYLEIAINCGSAQYYFKAKKGDAVKVIRAKKRY